ncbi:hypothetical protein GJ744_005982 [Endocarpon pusillum]|uniref:Uncharacterized protein n=1 Tax=Endocarpon pusillum TaxID=364733 RepID=A0A8H7E0X6_9EURO|nr:hypothetical protein GJ744_005982 [Endocarpon pusillum]
MPDTFRIPLFQVYESDKHEVTLPAQSDRGRCGQDEGWNVCQIMLPALMRAFLNSGESLVLSRSSCIR